MRRDPARRGLIAADERRGAVCSGHLAAAADDLSESATRVAIVTGFYIPRAVPPAAETDGPLGSTLLAAALEALGIECRLITDEPCAAAVACAAGQMGLDRDRVIVAPHDGREWSAAFLKSGWGSRLSHLVAIERVGPSHTIESLSKQARVGPPPLEAFERTVPEASRNRCHNMRATVIDDWTANLHELFEAAHAQRPDIRTIGVGDGGNEIGMGSIAWEEIVARLDHDGAGLLPCRIATDWTILAGVSNWGAMALAAGVLALRRRLDVLAPWTCRQQELALEELVRRGPAVDGKTARAEATVDGLPFAAYIQPWGAIRRLFSLPE